MHLLGKNSVFIRKERVRVEYQKIWSNRERKTLRDRENGEDAAHVCIKNKIDTILTIELITTGKFKTKTKIFFHNWTLKTVF